MWCFICPMIAPYWTDFHPSLCRVSLLLFSLVYQVFCDGQLALVSLILISLTVCVAKLLIWFCGLSRSLEQAMFTLEILFSKHLHLLLATTCIQYVEIFPVEALQLKPTPWSAYICAWINSFNLEASKYVGCHSWLYLFVFHSICITGFLGLTHLQMLFNWTDCVDFIDQRSSRKMSLSRLIQFPGNHAKEGKEDFGLGIKLESARQ